MFGKVYVAQRVDVPEHQVALKLLPRSLYAGRNVERELVMLATVGHPHVVQLKDHGTTADYVWLTMPVYKGETLAERSSAGRSVSRGARHLPPHRARARGAPRGGAAPSGRQAREHLPRAFRRARAPDPARPRRRGRAGRDVRRRHRALRGARAGRGALERRRDLPLSEKMDTYGLAATLLLALVGPEHFPGEGADSRLEIVQAQDLRARARWPRGAHRGYGTPRKMLSAAFCRWMNPDPLSRPPVRVMADELEVLLEPEREQERRRARRSRSISLHGANGDRDVAPRGRSGGALRVLQAPDPSPRVRARPRARRRGRVVRELDTCIASHQVARREATACLAAKSHQEEEYRAKLRQLAKTGGANEASFTRQMQALEATYTTRVKCAKTKRPAQREALEVEQKQQTWDWQRKEMQLTGERDEQHKLAETRGRATSIDAAPI